MNRANRSMVSFRSRILNLLGVLSLGAMFHVKLRVHGVLKTGWWDGLADQSRASLVGTQALEQSDESVLSYERFSDKGCFTCRFLHQILHVSRSYYILVSHVYSSFRHCRFVSLPTVANNVPYLIE